MKFLFASIFSLLNITYHWIPSVSLLLAMAAAIGLDFITGVVKAIVQNEARTSQGYRKTVVKFVQYGGAVLVSMLLTFVSEQNATSIQYEKYIQFMGNALLSFIIFCETKSIFENMDAIDGTSTFAKYFIKPILKLLSFDLKNNALNKLTGTDEEKK